MAWADSCPRCARLSLDVRLTASRQHSNWPSFPSGSRVVSLGPEGRNIILNVSIKSKASKMALGLCCSPPGWVTLRAGVAGSILGWCWGSDWSTVLFLSNPWSAVWLLSWESQLEWSKPEPEGELTVKLDARKPCAPAHCLALLLFSKFTLFSKEL